MAVKTLVHDETTYESLVLIDKQNRDLARLVYQIEAYCRKNPIRIWGVSEKEKVTITAIIQNWGTNQTK